MAFKKGKPRCPTAGRKKGTPNKPHPITMDFIETLRRLGHDPAAVHIQLYRHSWNRYLRALKAKNQWGANGALQAAIQANGDLMKYAFPTRKAVDHQVSGGIMIGTYADMAKALLGGGTEESGRDVTESDEGEESP